MEYQLSGVDLYFLTQEFQELVSGKIDKIYQIDKKELLFNFHVPGIGKKSLRIKVPDFIYLTLKRPKTPETPPGFCMFLRKRLGNSRLREVSQIGLERILKLVFETKDSKYILFIELFSKGNMVLCDMDMNIIQPLEWQKWKDRMIKTKGVYKLPEARINPLDVDPELLKKLLENTKKDKLVTFLAIEFGLGGKYAEVICDGFDKNQKPAKADASKLDKAIKKFFKQSKEGINKEIDDMIDVEEAVDTPKENKKVDKQLIIIQNQEEHIKKLELDIEKYNKMGEVVYSNYQELTTILNQFNEARKEMSIKEIKKNVKNKKILEINEKEKTIVFELD